MSWKSFRGLKKHKYLLASPLCSTTKHYFSTVITFNYTFLKWSYIYSCSGLPRTLLITHIATAKVHYPIPNCTHIHCNDQSIPLIFIRFNTICHFARLLLVTRQKNSKLLVVQDWKSIAISSYTQDCLSSYSCFTLSWSSDD